MGLDAATSSECDVADDTKPPSTTRTTQAQIRSTSVINEVSTTESPKRWPWLTEIIHIALEQWFLVALGLLIAVASQVQIPQEHQKLKRTVTSYLCISIIFFVSVLNSSER